MSDKFIPIRAIRNDTDQNRAYKDDLSDESKHLQIPNGQLFDSLHRPLRDLRISVTDRCNFRCTYCMPKEVFDKNYPYLPHSDLLSFEEIVQIAKAFIAHGVTKIRLTGGEPLLRKNIENLISMLSALTTSTGKKIDLSLTTNGALLAKKAFALKSAGLSRLTVSLDALDDGVFKKMNDVDFPVASVLDGIKEAQNAGFENIKINMVVKRGVNDQEISNMARYFKTTPHILRFIEYMDVGASNAWNLNEVLDSAEIIGNLQNAGLPLNAVERTNPSETAERYRYADGQGEIGFISSVSKAFCHACSRARLSTQGKLYTCLFASEGHDLRAILRDENLQNPDRILAHRIAQIWHQRGDRYSELRSEKTDNEQSAGKKIEMSYIGG
jgi:cyclic pyranopterin phosphate synthase